MVRDKKLSSRLLLGGCIAIITTTVVAIAGRGPRASVEVRVGVAPTPFNGSDGQTHLAYELVITGVSGTKGARLERVEVFGELDAKPLLSYAREDLDERVMRPEADPKVRYGRLIPSGTTALIHVWITLAKDQAVPRTLRHSFTISAEDGSAVTADEARVDVHAATPLVVGSPFRTGAWLAHNGPGQHRSAHWGSVLVNERGARIPQRHAIDFIGVDDNGFVHGLTQIASCIAISPQEDRQSARRRCADCWHLLDFADDPGRAISVGNCWTRFLSRIARGSALATVLGYGVGIKFFFNFAFVRDGLGTAAAINPGGCSRPRSASLDATAGKERRPNL